MRLRYQPEVLGIEDTHVLRMQEAGMFQQTTEGPLVLQPLAEPAPGKAPTFADYENWLMCRLVEAFSGRH
jgi:hypothetical protein